MSERRRPEKVRVRKTDGVGTQERLEAHAILRRYDGSLKAIAAKVPNRRGKPIHASTMSSWFRGFVHPGIAREVRRACFEIQAREAEQYLAAKGEQENA